MARNPWPAPGFANKPPTRREFIPPCFSKESSRSDPTFASIVHDNLAVVLRNESSRVRGQQSTEFLRGAVRNYDESLRGLSELSDGTLWAATNMILL